MFILIFIIMLVVLIVGHEFGHFIVAKLSGMKVPEFGLGFPPKLWGKKIGDTEYTINALPFGGFVRIVGEDAAEASSDPAAFNNRPKVLQALTLLAGPFANIVLAFVFFSIAFMAGVPVAAENDSRAVDPRVVVASVLPESPAAETGIQAGDQVVSITSNGTSVPIQKPEDIVSVIANSQGVVRVELVHGGAPLSLEITPQKGLIPDDPERVALGISSASVGMLRLNPFDALVAGFTRTVEEARAVAVGLGTLIGSAFTLSADVKDLAGPVGIATLTGEAAQFGAGSLLAFAALISLNLGILNLLPFPALDGGRLAFLIVETVIRRPIPLNVTRIVNTAGFAILILLMIAVTANDIFRLIG